MPSHSSKLKNFLIGALALGVVGYAFFNARFIIKGPEIIVDAQGDRIVTDDNSFSLTGKILHSSFISINGRPILVDEQGNFKEELLLSDGVSIIDIYAKDRFGKEVRKKIDVLYQGHTPSVDFVRIAKAAEVSASGSPAAVATVLMAKVAIEESVAEQRATSSTMTLYNATTSSSF